MLTCLFFLTQFLLYTLAPSPCHSPLDRAEWMSTAEKKKERATSYVHHGPLSLPNPTQASPMQDLSPLSSQ